MAEKIAYHLKGVGLCGCCSGTSFLSLLMMAVLLVMSAVMLPTQDAAGAILATPNCPPGGQTNPGPVLLFEFEGTGPLTELPSIQGSFFNGPCFAAFNAQGELFVGNRHGNVGGGQGSITRLTVDANGNVAFNGLITGNSLEAVHGLTFSPTGELFAANLSNGTISRFLFDAQGNAIPNGVITTGVGNQEGLVFAPNGELFAANYGSILRFLFDPATGAAIPHGSFAIPGSGRLHGVALSAQGELFVADVDTARVFRFLFDSAGNPVSNGTISVPGDPVGVAFSSVAELFVTRHSSGGISRFLFDGAGNAISNGFIATPQMGGPAVFPGPMVPPPPPPDQCLVQLSQCQQNLAAAEQETAALQDQVDTLSTQNAQLQQQLQNLTGGVGSGLTILQNDFQAVFNNPTFEIPGATLLEQYQNLITAILNLNQGRKMGIYTNLGGKP